MMYKKKISIITPCYNAEALIDETIQSVLLNKAVIQNEVDLELIICDGGSTDGTVKLVESLLADVRSGNITAALISEKDSGMYDALAKGLKQATGDIISYINAGDLFSPGAFEIALEIFNFDKINWLTGFLVQYNEKSHLTGVWLPYRYSTRLIQTGFYNHRMLPFLQQEGTFWSAELNRLLDFEKLSQLKYAGDFYLWKTFSQTQQLFIVETWLAGYKIHRGQMSEDMTAYFDEMKLLADPPKPADYIQAFYEKLIWLCPNGLKKKLNKKTMFSFDHELQRYTGVKE